MIKDRISRTSCPDISNITYKRYGLRGNAKRNSYLFLCLLSMIILGGCKTTVKNYQEAYDVAIGKQQREEEQRRELQKDLGLEQEELQDVGGARKMQLEGGDVWVLNATFARADSIRRYAVSVGNFKMPANAASMADDLKSEGYAKTTTGKSGDKYYVILDSFARQIDALNLLHEFEEKNKGRYYVGQPGAMLVIGGSPGTR